MTDEDVLNGPPPEEAAVATTEGRPTEVSESSGEPRPGGVATEAPADEAAAGFQPEEAAAGSQPEEAAPEVQLEAAVIDALSEEAPTEQPASEEAEEIPVDPAGDVAVAETLAAEPPADAPIRMAPEELKSVVEALVFASPDPITPKTLYKLLASESKDDVSTAINELRGEYLHRPGLALVEVAGGYQIVTRPELHEWVRRLFHERSTQKLSVAALESLAVIAYRQPVTALEITEIRGVNSSGVLSTLLERNLIKIVGRKNVVGRPFMYGTTKEFLIRFGLKDLGDLPKIEDMAEALGFNPPAGLIEQAPREEVLPLDENDEGSAAAAPPDGDIH
jgi:segregation and condensation protein B